MICRQYFDNVECSFVAFVCVKITVYIYGCDLGNVFVSFFSVLKSQYTFGLVIKGPKKDRFHKGACFLLACKPRRISGCCLSPPIITSLFSAETSDSRKYVCICRLVFCISRVCEAHYFHGLHGTKVSEIDSNRLHQPGLMLTSVIQNLTYL